MSAIDHRYDIDTASEALAERHGLAIGELSGILRQTFGIVLEPDEQAHLQFSE